MSKKKYTISQELEINGKIKQILPLKTNTDGYFMDCWIVEIPPNQSSKLIQILRKEEEEEEKSIDTSQILHLKRFRKTIIFNGQTFLQCLICPVSDEGDEKSFCKYIETKLQALSITSQLKKAKVPQYPAQTAESSKELLKKYWPMIWKGDPNLQMLQQEVFEFDIIRKNLHQIIELSKQSKNEKIVTMMCNTKTGQPISISTDQRHTMYLDHSVIACINKVAQQEQSRRKDTNINQEDKNYLCLNLDVYTTHEPCSYCCMALSHSRVGRVFFIKQVKSTGSICPNSGQGYCIHQNKKLNWRFHCYQWCDNEDILELQLDPIDDSMFI